MNGEKGMTGLVRGRVILSASTWKTCRAF